MIEVMQLCNTVHRAQCRLGLFCWNMHDLHIRTGVCTSEISGTHQITSRPIVKRREITAIYSRKKSFTLRWRLIEFHYSASGQKYAFSFLKDWRTKANWVLFLQNNSCLVKYLQQTHCRSQVPNHNQHTLHFIQKQPKNLHSVSIRRIRRFFSFLYCFRLSNIWSFISEFIGRGKW